MIIGVPHETHRHEHRVGLTPYAARSFVEHGQVVVVEQNAGREALFSDEEYRGAGAQVVYSTDEVFQRADLICRVGVSTAGEVAMAKPGSILCAFQHLAVQPRALVEAMRRLELTVIGYELIQDAAGDRPVLLPFSEMAGEMAVFVAAHYLQNEVAGRGILLGAVPGIAPPTVLILGAGTVGRTAARRAAAIGAHVIVLDESLEKLRALSTALSGQVVTQLISRARLTQYTALADVLIGAILIPGERAPYLVTEEMVRRMRTGSVIIDVSIDQGGCVETSRPTTPDHPTYVVHDVVHYCVPNMTANVARTASRALADAITAPVGTIARDGLEAALRADAGLAAGVYLYRGHPVHEKLAVALDVAPTALNAVLGEGAAS